MGEAADRVTCDRPGCGEPLPVQAVTGLRLAYARFPATLAQCYLHLVGTPTVLRCPVCDHENDVADAVLCMGRDATYALLFLPETRKLNDDQIDALRAAIALDVGGSVDVVHESRLFRRAFLNRFVSDHVTTLNQGILAAADGKSFFEWVRGHEAELGYDFMAAIWLLLMGAVPLGAQKLDPSSPESARLASESFRPAAEHTPAFERESRQLARDQLARAVGEILAHRLTLLVLERCGPVRSWTPALNELSGFCPREMLLTEAAQALAAETGKRVDAYKIGEKGAIAGRYLFEGVHALLHHVCKTENPRRAAWSATLTLYEYMRRRDGDDEAFLLMPDVVRATIDASVFFGEIRRYGRAIGPFESKTRDAHRQLVETVERIYPEEATSVFEIALQPAETVTDEATLEFWSAVRLHELLNIDPELGPLQARHILRGIANTRPHLLRAIAQRIHALVTGMTRDAELRLRYASQLIELLNLYDHFGLALEIADATVAFLHAAERWPAPDLVAFAVFLNERGNCYRYGGRFDEALAAYWQALEHYKGDWNDRDARVVRRNVAIVLRSVGRLTEARRVLADLRTEAATSELPGIVTSEAICLIEEGLNTEALDLLERNQQALSGRSFGEPLVLRYISALAQCLLHAGRHAEAAEQFAMLSGQARKMGDVVTAAHIEALALRARKDTTARPAYETERTKVIAALREALPQALQVAGAPTAAFGIAHHLYLLLSEVDEVEEAERIVRRTAEALPRHAANVWLLRLDAADLAARRGDGDQLLEDLGTCIDSLDASLEKADPGHDPFTLLGERRSELVRLASALAEGVRSGWLSTDAVRLGADIQTSPVLTSRLGSLTGVIRGTTRPSFTTESTNALLAPGPAVLVQVLETEAGLSLVISVPDPSDMRTRIEDLGIGPAEADRVQRSLEFRLRHALPTDNLRELDTVAGWQDLRLRLYEAISANSRAAAILCIASGPLNPMLFSLAFAEAYPVAFVPSLAAAQHLRERHRRLPGGLAWRPSSLSNFVVWRSADKTSTVDAMRSATARLEAFALGKGLQSASRIGVNATADALVEELAASDLLRISCHGQGRAETRDLDLLVAADGRLPPSVVEAYADPRTGSQYLLGWARLAEAKRMPPVVVSSACDSGFSIYHAGGERLGLERPLLRAGTVAFVAPQWPVPVAEVQSLTCALVERYIECRDAPLSRTLWTVCREAEQAGIAALTARSLALFGDFV